MWCSDWSIIKILCSDCLPDDESCVRVLHDFLELLSYRMDNRFQKLLSLFSGTCSLKERLHKEEVDHSKVHENGDDE